MGTALAPTLLDRVAGKEPFEVDVFRGDMCLVA